ncbi:HpcH/HpaI aldolase family protein [Sediminivirga luteola]|uniref:2-keto-3-deoxy-L-rhamnonate aldolase n=1 Tax=Sediminivirga luteola TaxID=1774748 RepID=A0A8J2TV43_9MICO|nr:aldolase/citrate lyase family protein [Sediminivirga luteola]MCI2264631.1 aldolase/citrate lyase family protein [Sediminivirga luteola]GGA02870.1 2-keto-3-deoxy-L-rhamnonate aldolase [Sediminivirga luteola]
MNEALRNKLAANETAFGLWVTSEASAVTEVAGLLGIDWICIDMEHGYLDYRDIQTHLSAARGTNLTVLVRPPSQELEPIKRALDVGAHGAIVPLIDSAEELHAVHEHFYYPPLGRRGIGGERSVKWGLDLEQYVTNANDELLLIPMIETQRAYENLDEILSADKLETVFLGPGDMSASRGAVGEWEGPGVAEMNLDILRRATDRGISSGIVARSTEEAITRRDQGFGMVSLGSDIGLMIRQIKTMAEALGKETTGHRWF